MIAHQALPSLSFQVLIQMNTIIGLIKSQAFLEKIVLLVAAAGLSGLLVPVITAKIANTRLQEQKLFEAELARQTKVIDAQVQLLEQLAELLWEYQLLAIDVSYYHFAKDQNLYTTASKKYEEKAGTILCKIRAEISKSLRLTSPQMYQKLKNLYYKELLGLDLRVRNLVDGHDNKWAEFNNYAVRELSEIVDIILNDLARELKLRSEVFNSKQSATAGDM